MSQERGVVEREEMVVEEKARAMQVVVAATERWCVAA